MPLKDPEKIKEYNKQYREANKQKILEQKKQYREANKQKISESNKQYREANQGKIVEKLKQYYQENKEALKEKQTQYYEATKQSNPLDVKIKEMISSSNKSDKKCNRIGNDIDYEFLYELWNNQEKMCYYCKCEMLLEFNAKSRNPQQVSIQRLDNELAHTKANCVFACFDCNVCKRMELK